MAARRPSSALGRVTPKGFVAGAKVEYYSKSYDEWIPANVGSVRPDGSLRLLHDDGTVLKESAPRSNCRLATGLNTPEARSQPSAKKNGIRAPSPAPKSAIAKASGRSSVQSHAGSPAAPIGGPDLNDALSVTINPKRIWPGDKVKLKDSGREGEVMYIGWPSFASGEIVGVRLDDKRTRSECDGKVPTGERFFRCAPGFGIFLPSDEAEVLPRVLADNFPFVSPPGAHLARDGILRSCGSCPGQKTT